MTEPTPTPAKQNLSATPDSEGARQNENSSTPERDGFFKRVRRGLNPELPPVHPSEAAEIVIDIEQAGKEDIDKSESSEEFLDR